MGYTDVTTITMTPDVWGGITVTVTGTSQVVYSCMDSTLGVMPPGPGGRPHHLVQGLPLPGRV